ncbi:hypothetical protein ES708_08001 [subsurface metagenome]
MDKWDKLRKHERNQSIIRYKQNRSKTTLENMGRIFHISKQRVSVILKTYNGGAQ